MSVRGEMFKAVTGRDGDVSGAGGVRDMLAAAFGTSPRTRSRVDVKAAAKALKVTTRTVQRWLKDDREGRPVGISTEHMKTIQRRSRQAASTKRGRQAATRRIRERMPRQPQKIYVYDNQGPTGEGQSDYTRSRMTYATLDPDQYEMLLQAWENGGEDAALGYLEGIWAAGYLGNPDEQWNFSGAESFQINFGSPPGRP